MKSHDCIHTISSHEADSTFGVPPAISRIATHLDRWIARSRQRRQLATLNDALLKDIGLTRADVRIETGKPFWRP